MNKQELQFKVPPDKAERDAILEKVRAYCARQELVPPLMLDELEAHAARIIAENAITPEYKAFIIVLAGNEVWRGAVAATPFERRILLLPQCLKSSKGCQAEHDALGLLCRDCGLCPISALQREAEKLGYVVLVAEGATAVAALLARGEAEAVVGVSCLSGLEKSFRPLTAHAVPGLAVPLLRDGCRDTAVDADWVMDILRLRSDGALGRRPDLDALRREVAAWFEPSALRDLIGADRSATAEIAAGWVEKGGKRWRPLLVAAAFRALHPGAAFPDALRRVAVAVECFHKASLVHDDIEDGDHTRYGEQTLHRRHGLEVALNAGDLLIGEGYRLIAGSGAADAQVRELAAVAAEGHRTLCLGQGEELLLRRESRPAPVAVMLEIFRRKTAPAFEVALQMGAILAGADPVTRAALTGFSSAIGVAYQVADDLDDGVPGQTAADKSRLSILAALESEKDPGPAAAALEERAREIVRRYEDEALRALKPLRQPALKCLLYRVAALILHNPAPS